MSIVHTFLSIYFICLFFFVFFCIWYFFDRAPTKSTLILSRLQLTLSWMLIHIDLFFLFPIHTKKEPAIEKEVVPLVLAGAPWSPVRRSEKKSFRKFDFTWNVHTTPEKIDPTKSAGVCECLRLSLESDIASTINGLKNTKNTHVHTYRPFVNTPKWNERERKKNSEKLDQHQISRSNGIGRECEGKEWQNPCLLMESSHLMSIPEIYEAYVSYNKFFFFSIARFFCLYYTSWSMATGF